MCELSVEANRINNQELENSLWCGIDKQRCIRQNHLINRCNRSAFTPMRAPLRKEALHE